METIPEKFILFFFVVLIVPAGVSYLGGLEQKLDSLFFIRAFGIAFFLTVCYILVRQTFCEFKKG